MSIMTIPNKHGNTYAIVLNSTKQVPFIPLCQPILLYSMISNEYSYNAFLFLRHREGLTPQYFLKIREK